MLRFDDNSWGRQRDYMWICRHPMEWKLIEEWREYRDDLFLCNNIISHSTNPSSRTLATNTKGVCEKEMARIVRILRRLNNGH